MKQEKQKTVKIPIGNFCGGNCSDCIYYESRKTDSNGRAYCNHYGHYYYPSERQGCLSYNRK